MHCLRTLSRTLLADVCIAVFSHLGTTPLSLVVTCCVRSWARCEALGAWQEVL